MLKTPSLYLALLCLVACLYWPTHSSASNKFQNPELSPLASSVRGCDAGRSEALPAPHGALQPTCKQLIWDNGPFNNVDGLASEENTDVTNARTADDFVLTSAAAISLVSFDIYVWPGDYTGAVDIYADSGGNGPVNALPLATYTSTTFDVVGSGFGLEIRRYWVALSPPLNLTAGRYWVSGYVIGTGSGRGYLCTSNGATPDPGQSGYFRSTYFGAANWVPVTVLANHLRDFAFTVCGGGLPNVNDQVQLLTYPSGNAALLGCTGYTNRLILTGQLTNIGPNTLSDIAIRVRGLGFPDLTNPNNVIVATPNPHRLATADNFTACTTGGLAGALQTTINGKSPIGSNTPIPTLNPGQTTALFFRIHCPTTRLPIRFLVDVLAVVGGGGRLTDQETVTARQVVRTVEVEVRRSPQGKLIADVLGERPTPTSAAAASVRSQATRDGKR